MTIEPLNNFFEMPPELLLVPAPDGEGRTSAYRSLKHILKGCVICRVTRAEEAPITFTLLQGRDVFGANAKLANPMRIWLRDEFENGDAFVPKAPGASFTIERSSTGKTVVFEVISASALDLQNEFTALAVQTSPSSAANVTSAGFHIFRSALGHNLFSNSFTAA